MSLPASGSPTATEFRQWIRSVRFAFAATARAPRGAPKASDDCALSDCAFVGDDGATFGAGRSGPLWVTIGLNMSATAVARATRAAMTNARTIAEAYEPPRAIGPAELPTKNWTALTGL